MKYINKLLIILGLISTINSTQILTAATSGNITLSGQVLTQIAITVTSQVGYNTLSLTNSVIDQLVAKITEVSNKKNYIVSIASLNNGKFVGITSPDTLTYTLKYGLESPVLSSTPVNLATRTEKTPKIGTEYNFTISYTIQDTDQLLSADTYSDTLTVTITAP